MLQAAAVWCDDKRSLPTLETTLDELGIKPIRCRSRQRALELVMDGRCSILIVDFDLPGAEDAIRMANLLPPGQKPILLAVASRVWPGTGQAFQSGARRILYRPLEAELLREALKAGKNEAKLNRRKSARYEARTMISLQMEGGTLSAICTDIGDNGLALQAVEAVPMNSNVEFRCTLPGTELSLHGHADVVWAGNQGRAGLFFSKLSPASRKHLKQWLHKRANQNRNGVRYLLPPSDEHVSFANEEELPVEVQK